MGVINDIVNFGKIALLKNDTLRNFISYWEGLINKLQLREEGLLNRQEWLTKFIIENGNDHNTGYYVNEKKVPKSRFKKGNLPLLEMTAFEGLVSNISGPSIRLRNLYYPQFKEKLVQQMAIIDRALE